LPVDLPKEEEAWFPAQETKSGSFLLFLTIKRIEKSSAIPHSAGFVENNSEYLHAGNGKG